MPIYEYQCKKCGDEFERIQGFFDNPLKKCMKCGGSVRKLVSESSFHLKGSGWYVTDYANSSSKKVEKPKKPAEKKESTSKTTDSGKKQTSTTCDKS